MAAQISGTGAIGLINSMTAVNSTSGTSIDFTGIPSGVKRITIMLKDVSTSGTSYKLIQLGSGSITTTGYAGNGSYATTAVTSANFTNGMGIINGGAAENISGICTIVLQNSSTNTWVMVGNFPWTAGVTGNLFSGAVVSLSGTLDRVRITTVNGTDTFDNGSINVLYE